MPDNVTIRVANINDISGLTALNKKWQRSILGADTGRGFLSGEISRDAFSSMIINKEIAIAENGTFHVVGYQLISNSTNTSIISIHGALIDEIKNNHLLPADAKVGIGVQICVDTPYQGTGVKTQLLKEICRLATGKYDYLFSTVGKDNERSYKAHKSDGWEIIYETDKHYCILYKL